MPIIKGETDEEYRASGALTSSLVREYIKHPMCYYYAKQRTRADTKSLGFGRLFHMRALEPDRFAQSVVCQPAGIDRRTKAGRQWAEVHAGREIITRQDMDTVDLMMQNAPLEFLDFVAGADCEVSYRDDNCTIQCRVDAISKILKVDLKTINNIDHIEKHIDRYGYDYQEAWYDFVIDTVAGSVPPSMMWFAETESPYRWAMVTIDKARKARVANEVAEAYVGIQEFRPFTPEVDQVIVYDEEAW